MEVLGCHTPWPVNLARALTEVIRNIPHITMTSQPTNSRGCPYFVHECSGIQCCTVIWLFLDLYVIRNIRTRVRTLIKNLGPVSQRNYNVSGFKEDFIIRNS